MLKMAAGLTNKVAFHSDSPRSSSPSETEDRPLSASMSMPTNRRPSNLTRANVKAAAAAAAERKGHQVQHPAGRKVSIVGEPSRGTNALKTTGGGGGPLKSDVVDQLSLEEDDDDDDPDMMSLDNSMIGTSVDLRDKQRELRATANTSVRQN